jgi:hypothetical protein
MFSGGLELSRRPSEDRLPADSHGASQLALPQRTADQPAQAIQLGGIDRFICPSLGWPIEARLRFPIDQKVVAMDIVVQLTPEADYRALLLRDCNDV